MPIDLNFSKKILYVNFSQDLKKEDLEYFRRQFSQIDENFCAIFDFSQATKIPIDLVIEQLKYIREYEAMVKGRLVASSILVQSQMKKIINTAFKVIRPASPCLASCDAMDCREFVQDHLELWEIESRKHSKK